MSKTVTTRLDDQSVKKIDELAAKKGVDRSAVLRSFFLYALKDHQLQECIKDYEASKITLWEAAERCDLSLWEIIQEMKRSHIHACYDIDALRKDLEAMDLGDE
jgi:predicted HTH domain antitoxin